MSTRIKDVADRKGITYTEIAKQMGISRQSLTNWTTGQRKMKLDDLQEIANILQCEIAELLPAGKDFDHTYNEHGEWLGIRRKNS
ncbi:helix-turn-helix domain-containing protein [Chryseobacterium proteolyticum]|uniref:helix-turn-helix domain-containing protein n=1 Tax=Chryseobacterium proteolyticum TaxID=118127 RepID=UPI0039838090